jgi:hypothetical protein
MKTFSLILLGLLAAGSASAVTNIIVIGDSRPPMAHTYFGPSINYANIALILFFFLIGMFHLFFPRVCWWFKWGWRFADSEPSALWLFFERAGGVVIIAITLLVVYLMNFAPK